MDQSLSFDLNRFWFNANLKHFGKVELGSDKGTVILQMRKDALVALLDYSGKVILTKQNEVFTIIVESIQGSTNNGEQLPASGK